MPRVAVNGVSLHYDEAGAGPPTHFINLDEPDLFNQKVLDFLSI